MSLSACLVCNCSQEATKSSKLLELDSTNSSLSEELSPIFIIRKLLGVSPKVCEELLQSTGNPSKWGLQFCPLCYRIIEEAHFVFQRIQKLVGDFEELSSKLKTKTVNSVNSRGPDDVEGNSRRKRTIGRKRAATEVAANPSLQIRRQVFRNFEDKKSPSKLPILHKVDKVEPSSFTISSDLEDNPSQTEHSNSNQNTRTRTRGRGKAAKQIKTDDGIKNEITSKQEIDDPGGSAEAEPVIIVKSEVFLDVEEIGDCDTWPEDENDDKCPNSDPEFDPVSEGAIGNKDNSDADMDQAFEDGDDDNDSDFELKSPRSRARPGNRRKSKSSRAKTSSHKTPRKKGRKFTAAMHKYACTEPDCKLTFPQQHLLDAHILRRHYGDPFPYPCDLCDKRFPYAVRLQVHRGKAHREASMNSYKPFATEEYASTARNDEEKGAKKEELSPEEVILVNSIKFGEAQWICDEDSCARKFKNELQFEGHKNFHRGVEKPYICPVESCKRAFVKFPCLLDHCHRHLNRTYYVCSFPDCNKRFRYKLSRECHEKKVHQGIKAAIPCSVARCKKKFASRYGMISHLKTRHNIQPGDPLALNENEIQDTTQVHHPTTSRTLPLAFKCSKCQQRFPSRLAVEGHLRKVHFQLKASFSCKECPQKFITEASLSKHLLEKHSADATLKDFDRAEKKKRPRIETPLTPPYICKICNCEKEFKNAITIRSHILRHNHTNNYSAMCEFCSQAFTAVRYMKEHQRRVHYDLLGVEPFTCEVCGKILNCQRTMDYHMQQVHTKDCPHKCTFCPRSFVMKSSLENHRRICHTKEKPFKCSYCPKSFPHKGYLKNHLRMHTGEKPFKCKYCERVFSDKPTCNRHMETHGDKIHKCEDCGKEFKIWHAFRIHRKTHDKSLPKRQSAKRRRRPRDRLEDESSNSNNISATDADTNSAEAAVTVSSETQNDAASFWPNLQIL